jgi:putative isomerase
MTINRREFLNRSASVLGLAAVGGKALAQTQSMPPAAAPAAAAAPAMGAMAPAPATPATKLLYADVGEKCWQDLHMRLVGTNSDLKNYGLRTIPGVKQTLLTGYPYNEFYDWDLYFENMYLSYYGVWPYCFTNLTEFLDRQKPDGFISRSLIKDRPTQHFKPFLAQLVVLGAKQNHDDYGWLKGNYYDRLTKYLVKWFSYDYDNNGLPVWNSCDAAGTDNQWSRAGCLDDFQVEGVDLASYLIRELRAMAVIGDHLGHTADVHAFNAHADKVAKLMNQYFWDEDDGMYYDRNEKTNRLVKVKSATCFMPFFAQAATAERAQRTITQHLLSENEFWTEYPVASYAKTEPDYYQGSHRECNWRGSTWAPTNYMIFQGLRKYGYNEAAKDLATRLFQMSVEKNAVLREYYNAETGGGLGQTRFWGFTALYYAMLLEYHANYDASDLKAKFRPIVTEQLGIKFETT